MIGGNLLAGHVVDIDPHGRSLTIDGPAPSNGFETINLELVMNVPIVGIEVAGQRVSAAIDTGARISFAHANLLAGAPRIGEREDFYPGWRDCTDRNCRICPYCGGCCTAGFLVQLTVNIRNRGYRRE
jgi:hypothetical protein